MGSNEVLGGAMECFYRRNDYSHNHNPDIDGWVAWIMLWLTQPNLRITSHFCCISRNADERRITVAALSIFTSCHCHIFCMALDIPPSYSRIQGGELDFCQVLFGTKYAQNWDRIVDNLIIQGSPDNMTPLGVIQTERHIYINRWFLEQLDFFMGQKPVI